MGNTTTIIKTVTSEPTDSSLQEGEKVLFNGNEYQKRNGKSIKLDNGAGIVGQSQVAEPTVEDNSFRIWMANASGTKDGTAYEQSDVLLTVVDNSGTSKTLILADFSAL